MKTIKKISMLVLATVISSFALSCSSSDDGGSGGSAAEGTIKAKVDETWVETLEMVTFATQVGTTLQLQGNTGGTSSKAFVFTINGFEGTGTYDLGGEAGAIGTVATYTEIVVDPSNPEDFEQTSWTAPYEGGDKVGEIQVAEYEEGEYIKGTFHFEAKNTTGDDKKNVTEGSFYINFL